MPLTSSPFAAVRVVSPEQLGVDVRSRALYSALGSSAAVALADRTFRVDVPGWTDPVSPSEVPGASYPAAFTATVPSGRGGHLLVESTVPLRARTATGRLEPVSLALRDVDEAFVPANPIVPVAISKDVRDGVSLMGPIGVTPGRVTGGGRPTVVGDRVVWANAARDSDFMVEPVPLGFEAFWQLRSQWSPTENSLTFRLPAGDALRLSSTWPGAAEVVAGSRRVLLIPPASAVQADGEPSTVSYSVAGDVLTAHVDLQSNVDFPVMVDPEVIGYYGEYDSGSWENWLTYQSCSCFSFTAGANLVEVGANPGDPDNSYGEWYTGVAESNSARITRVDLSGLYHQPADQSDIDTGIFSDNGKGIWTTNGYAGAMGPQPLDTYEAFSGQALAVCAEAGGGTESNGKLCGECKEEGGTCVEDYGGKTFALAEVLGPEVTQYNYVRISGAAIRYIQTTPPSATISSPLPPEKEWVRDLTDENLDYVQMEATDQGTGIAEYGLDVLPGQVSQKEAEEKDPPGSHPFPESPAHPEGPIYKPTCHDPFCPSLTYHDFESEWLTGSGVYTLLPWARNAVDLYNRQAYDVYLDKTPPVIETPSWAGQTFSEGPHLLWYSAVDGSLSAPQSGVESLELLVDGTKVADAKTGCPKPHGIPASDCFGMTSNWTLRGEDYGAGPHKITIRAYDWVGNVREETYTVTIEHPVDNTQTVGPGTLNLLTGDYKLAATDVSIAAGAADLTVARTYDSQSSVSGPLGPGWLLSTPDTSADGQWQSLEVTSEGVIATITSGQKVTFIESEESYVSPRGFQTFTLSKVSSSPEEFEIADAAGDYTRFAKPAGASVFSPTSVGQAIETGGLNKVTYALSEGRTTEIRGPEPAGAACAPEMEKGCRELKLEYASATTAKGEARSEWGSYKGRLASVMFVGTEPSSGETVKIPVAAYEYDGRGRLRAEWDPRVSTTAKDCTGEEHSCANLKTTYGYDTEGHLTAIDPPGQEPWVIAYGAAPKAQGSVVRVTSVTRGAAGALLWNGGVVKNTEAPTMSAPARETGQQITVADGKWTDSPVVFTYQWLDCQTPSETGCEAIPGATGKSYTVRQTDVGHLGVRVTATNGGGSESVFAQQASFLGAFPVGEPGAALYGRGLAVDGSGNLWVATGKCVYEHSQEGALEKTICGSPEESFKEAAGVAVDHAGDIWIADSERNRLYEFNGKGEFLRRISGTLLKHPAAVATDSEGNVWIANTKADDILEYNQEGTKLLASFGEKGSGSGQLDQPYGIAVDASGNIWVSDTEANRVYEYNRGGHLLNTVGKGLYHPMGLAFDATGDLWLAVAGNGKPKAVEFTPSGELLAEFATSRSAWGIGLDAAGHVWVSDVNGEQIEKWLPGTASEGENAPAGAATSTINYEVPVSGSEAPYQLGSSETERWGQSEGPTTATAITPPGGAASLARASIYYFDGAGRLVDTASPGGRIATAQYNSYGETIRSLTPGNRQRALSAGEASKATAEKLETESIYSADGTELDETLGPQHEVAIAGSVVKARAFTRYSYDEKAPSYARPTRLVTKTEEGAHLESGSKTGKEAEVRTIKDAYSGQEDLGWQLHKPTSITTEPEHGETSTRTTVYSSETGDVLEAEAPGTGKAKAAHDAQYTYYTAAANSKHPSCGNHPEWVNLPCLTQVAKQPAGSLPPLPETVTTYNLWQQPQTVTATSGEHTRKAETSYDPAGRAVEVKATSDVGKPLPAVSDRYDPGTGLIVEQSETVEGHARSLRSEYNTLGELVGYTDASGNKSTETYDVAGQIETEYDGLGTRTSSYDETTGALVKVTDTALSGSAFTASYDPEGQLETETYPNGMTVTFSENSVGQRTEETYAKGSATWYKDSVTPTIHGEWASQTTTLGSDTYAYDNLGRLTEATETPTGKDCTSYLYSYDRASDRTEETKRESTTATCPSTGGTTTTHSYDEAGRLTDTGTEYEPFGAATKVPAADAGGHVIEYEYYVNGAIASQTQAEQTNKYQLDPAGRLSETESTATGQRPGLTEYHYASPGATPAWASTNGTTTRNIPGIGIGLACTQTNDATPVLEITNLHGDDIGTVTDTERAAPKLVASEPTAFGVPTTPEPAQYSWLGAGGLKTEFPTGTATTQNATAYIPQLGLYVGAQELRGHAAQDPINEYAASGTEAQPAWSQTWKGPGAIEPSPVSSQVLEEFWANPPWNVEPNNGEEQVLPWVEDPSGLLTPGEAKLLTYSLRYGTKIVGVAWPEAWLFIEALELLGTNPVNEAAEKLERCYQPLYEAKQTDDAKCKVFVDLEFGFVPAYWGVELCWKKEYKRKNKRHVTYPYCEPT